MKRFLTVLFVFSWFVNGLLAMDAPSPVVYYAPSLATSPPSPDKQAELRRAVSEGDIAKVQPLVVNEGVKPDIEKWDGAMRLAIARAGQEQPNSFRILQLLIEESKIDPKEIRMGFTDDIIPEYYAKYHWSTKIPTNVQLRVLEYLINKGVPFRPLAIYRYVKSGDDSDFLANLFSKLLDSEIRSTVAKEALNRLLKRKIADKEEDKGPPITDDKLKAMLSVILAQPADFEKPLPGAEDPAVLATQTGDKSIVDLVSQAIQRSKEQRAKK